MGLLDSLSNIPMRQLHLLFAIGSSESMSGTKMGSINDAIMNIQSTLEDMASNNPDAHIFLNVMSYSDECKWQCDSPVPIQDFIYQPLLPKGKENNIGKCYKSLNEYLVEIQKTVLVDELYSPIIVLITDRNSSDNSSIELRCLQSNSLFQNTIKIAIPIGDQVNVNDLRTFTGSSDTVISVHSIDNIKNIIKLQPLSKDLIEKYQKKLHSSKRKLYNAISTVINQFGKDAIRNEKLINFLADYQAFENRPTKNVLRTFLQLGYGDKVADLDLCDSPDKQVKLKSYAYELIKNQGYQEIHVNYVIDCLAFGLGWTNSVPKDIIESQGDTSSNSHIISVNGINFTMIYVKGGAFDLGATPEQGIYAAFDEKPSVHVNLDDFYIAECPVTQALWQVVMNDNPSHFKGVNLPVERVSWEECQVFIDKLNDMTNYKFRLPTEAEWEYAARGGISSKHSKYAGSNDDDLSDAAWYKQNSSGASQDVKGKIPNELGIYDMSGNISEWCSDWYYNSYANGGSSTNPTGPSFGTNKVFRGGSWDDKAINCRVSKRFNMNPLYRNKLVGLRLAITKL